MGQQHDLTENEKDLLTVLGRYPDIPLKELVNHTQYKWTSTVVKKIQQFKEQNFLFGPVYSVDLGKLCRNSVHGLFCIIELGKSYSTVVEYLKLIKPLIWVYPVLSPHKELLNAGFFSSNDREIEALFQLLKDNAIITDYIIRTKGCKTIYENPNFFGDFSPSLDNLLSPCEVPDISFGHHHTDWNECDIRTLSYLFRGYESTKLIEILKKERNLQDKKWDYSQINYSFKKMVENKLITRLYFINPLPLHQCADFFLFLKTGDIDLTRRILHNFARGGRIYREYTLCDDWGLIGCVSHPQFVLKLMHELDQVEEITKKELYHVRSHPPGMSYVGRHSEFDYYDVEGQTMDFPYYVFREKIKEKIENEQ